MPPLDPDDLAMRAVDTSATTEPLVDLTVDDQATLTAYRRVIDAARHVDPPDHGHADEDAPAGLWAAISAELFEPASATEPGAAELRARNRWNTRSTIIAVAAAAVLLAGVLFAVRTTSSKPTVLAQAELGVLPPGDPTGAPGSGAGTARLEQRGDRYDLVVRTTDVTTPPTGDHYELWLLNLDGSEPVQPLSLGVMPSPNGELRAAVPPGVDRKQFDVVDISLQTNNGQHQHSGHSLLRGTLQ